MLAYHEVSGTNIIEITVDGKIGPAEFDGLVRKFEEAIERHGTVRVLERVKSFGGMPLGTWWEDFRFGVRHWSDVERAAVVADKTWIAVWTRMIKPFLKCEVRYFGSAEIEEARAWLGEKGADTARDG